MTDLDPRKRSSVPADRRWDPESIFPTVEAWETELDAILADLPSVTALAGRVGESSATVAAVLAARDELEYRLGRLSVYGMLGYAVETTDPDAVLRFGRVQAVDAQVVAAMSFVEPELLAIGRERLREWSATEPSLAALRPLLRRSLPAGGAHTLGRSRGGRGAGCRMRSPARTPSTAHSSTAIWRSCPRPLTPASRRRSRKGRSTRSWPSRIGR